jgi:hypothetical protein
VGRLLVGFLIVVGASLVGLGVARANDGGCDGRPSGSDGNTDCPATNVTAAPPTSVTVGLSRAPTPLQSAPPRAQGPPSSVSQTSRSVGLSAPSAPLSSRTVQPSTTAPPLGYLSHRVAASVGLAGRNSPRSIGSASLPSTNRQTPGHLAVGPFDPGETNSPGLPLLPMTGLLGGSAALLGLIIAAIRARSDLGRFE